MADASLSQRPDFPLLGSNWPTLTIVAAYVAFSLKIGPEFMKHREPFNMRYMLLAYNLLQVVLNFYYGIQAAYYYFSYDFDYGCLMPLPVEHPLRETELKLIYVFYLLKVLDLCDTVFFVLRKSFKQVTFLHVYHHLMILLFVFFVQRYAIIGGHLVNTGLLNLNVHGFMYFYYFLTALSPQTKRALWWKKYITLLQLTQFAALLVHNLWPLLMRPDCQYPRFLLYPSILQCVVMLALFGNFYWRTYLRSGSDRRSVAPQQPHND